jgi:hypothetical protein
MSDNTMPKRTIRATVTRVYSHEFTSVIDVIGEDGTQYVFRDDTETSGRRWWYRTLGSKIDFVVYDRVIEAQPGLFWYDLTTDDAISAD